MKITVVYDNKALKKGLKADWGFACLVEKPGAPAILFDTGADGSLLLHNLSRLGFQPDMISEVFISHAHLDHTGGLPDLLRLNQRLRVYLPASCPRPIGAAEVISIREPFQLHEGIFSTGELNGIEQSLIVNAGHALTVIVGCSHPGVRAILRAASRFGKVSALIGGLHGFSEFELLDDLKLVCPCHCTQFKEEIKLLYPEKCLTCGAGKVLEI